MADSALRPVREEQRRVCQPVKGERIIACRQTMGTLNKHSLDMFGLRLGAQGLFGLGIGGCAHLLFLSPA
jgi:hypothetical protein